MTTIEIAGAIVDVADEQDLALGVGVGSVDLEDPTLGVAYHYHGIRGFMVQGNGHLSLAGDRCSFYSTTTRPRLTPCASCTRSRYTPAGRALCTV